MKINKNNILKVMIMLIVSIVLMSQVSIAATTGTINYDTVRVRKEPNSDSSTVALTSIGDKVQVLEKSGDWYKVNCEYEGKNVTGYIRGDLIDVKDASKLQESNNTSTDTPDESTTQEPNTSTQEPPQQPDATINDNKPDEPNDTDQQEEPNDNNTAGKIDETIENQSETTLTTLKIMQSQLHENVTITLTKDVNIKIVPVVNSTNIATLPTGTTVRIVEVLNQWVRVETEEQIGWARIEQ